MQSIASPLWQLGDGQSLRQLTELGLALVFSTLIGLEREAKQKSAGLRTHTLVGVGSALFMEVSQHGFTNVLLLHGISFDPSRVAAQIVSGIGFIGGGLIFVRRDAVRGLTTAATVWLTCAIGMACGGGLPVLAGVATAVHFLVVRGYPLATRRLPAVLSAERVEIQLSYSVGEGLLARVLELCTGGGFQVLDVRVDRAPWKDGLTTRRARRRDVTEGEEEAAAVSADVLLTLEGTGDMPRLVAAISELDGMLSVGAAGEADAAE
ncbi:MgtC/SapB family protein [Peterkaempfera bronchialis]|uniref:MgtC/SapB family protein n=1 Tax=Peterkaempfera bronchialis TaxID=2126346 RepID=A0A345SVJ8_9ACTN|nr:MgtC/SapB family protein [Peterkaempfera bronchialis]AXI77753.1 MgtC/SapB family protein [Peterkaempfera bronchialis]